ncbi:MAG: DUF4157 domain-containing protein [Bacteroidota bacterium]
MGSDSAAKEAVPALPPGSNFSKKGRAEKKGVEADEIAETVTKITTQRKVDHTATAARNPEPFSSILQRKEDLQEGTTEDGGMAVSPYKPIQQKAIAASETIQRFEAPQQHNGGIPAGLRSGIENLSGFSMSDVTVNYNSSKPAQFKALAYAQGTNIDIAPGQERHLPHEAWHVVQQKQGRVTPTLQAKGIPVNDDSGLEHEADVMGAKAAQMKTFGTFQLKAEAVTGVKINNRNQPVQLEGGNGATAEVKTAEPGDAKAGATPALSAGDEVKSSTASAGAVGTPASPQGALESKGAEISAPSSIEEVAKGIPANYNKWPANNEVMLSILRGPFEANWFKARAALTMKQWPSSVPKEQHPPHDLSILFMNSMVDMRWKVWKDFTNKALAGMQAEVKERAANEAKLAEVKEVLDKQAEEKDKDKVAKTLDPVGSQAVTSDIDLSLGGSNTEIAVGFINREFRKEFKVPFDPGTFFDINVYASDWIHGNEETGETTGTTKVYAPKKEAKLTGEKAKQKREDDMEIWSIVKIRRNMHDHHDADNPDPDEWKAYKTGILSGIEDEPRRNAMEIKLAQANMRYLEFRAQVKNKMGRMRAELEAEEAKLRPVPTGEVKEGDPKPKSESKFKEDHFKDQGLETRASNAIYEGLLLEVKAIRARISQLKESDADYGERMDRLGVQLSYKITEALVYANEVYATEGSVQHTVLDQGASKKVISLHEDADKEALKPKGEQKQEILDRKNITKVKYDLRENLFLQSANENVGDSLHSLHAYHHLPFYAVYRAGKYMSRLIDASEKALKRPGLDSLLPNYNEIKDIGDKAMTLKSKKRDVGDFKGKNGLEGDPLMVEQDDFFKTFQKGGQVDELRPKIIQFGAAVPVLFNKARVDAEAKTP